MAWYLLTYLPNNEFDLYCRRHIGLCVKERGIKLKTIFLISLIATLLLSVQSVHARAQYFGFWTERYASSDSSEAVCQVCHQQASGGNGWNEYGWTIRNLLANQTSVSQFVLNGALAAVESTPSGSGFSFLQEIELNAQPGWRVGNLNVIRFRDAQPGQPIANQTVVPPDELCELQIDPNSSGVPCDAIVNPQPSGIPASDVQVRLETIATGFMSPIAAVSAPGEDGFIYVVEQVGLVTRVNLANGEKSQFLDFSDELVSNFGELFGGFDERGLLGFAFHPNFAQNNRVYTYISKDFEPNAANFSTIAAGETPDTDQRHLSVISQWQLSPAGNSMVETELLIVDQPQFNHNAGNIAFGPDGYLYIAFGDGGGADDVGVGHGENGNGSDNTNPLGAILRIDVDDPSPANGRYGIPSQNPFVGGPGLDEIVAFGFRNPFRFSFEELAGNNFNLYVGDVGQNEIEEIDRMSSNALGGNYGWNTKEGSFYFFPNDGNAFITDTPPPGFDQNSVIDPVAEYDHDEGISVIGGHVYTGSAIDALENFYVFADYGLSFSDPNGRLFHLDEQDRIFELITQDPIGVFITAIGRDNQNELYVMGTESIQSNSPGILQKIVPIAEADEEEPFCFPIVAANGNTSVICL